MLASRQHGVVSAGQLLGLGLTKQSIRVRLKAGRLHRIHAGVYAVGHPGIDRYGRRAAAVLAGGPAAMLSHRSAAAQWGLLAVIDTVVDVTVPRRSRRGRTGIRFHLPLRIDAVDRTVSHGIPTTTVARTLLDLAAILSPRHLERAFDEAERLELLNLRRMKELCSQGNRRGVRRLRVLVARCLPGTEVVRSGLELRFLKLCRDAGLPSPEVNQLVAGFEVDALWRDQRLIVELDGHAYHRGRAAFEHDRLRDAVLQAEGHRVVRFTERRLDKEARAVVATVEKLLGQGRRALAE